MLRLEARAKINWTLDIVGVREDGFHLMDMLMSSVALADTLELEAAADLSLSVTGEYAAETNGRADRIPPFHNNLTWRAACALQKATGCLRGAAMRLDKHIPVGAGMGGGSADAAAALIGLNRLWELSLPLADLRTIGLSLGADVPFALTGGLARVRGIGEWIEPLPLSISYWIVGIQPCGGLSTPEIFCGFDSLPEERILRPHTDKAQAALLMGDIPALSMAMGNVLEAVSLGKRPEMRRAVRALIRHGAARAMMTGSGSVVYGVFENEAKARNAYGELRAGWSRSFLTVTAADPVVFIN